MKKWLMGLNNGYSMFGTTIYVGVLWSLRFFWYPSWREFKVGNYYPHFIPQTDRATRFFTVVVPIMFVTLTVQVIDEWKGRFRWVPIAALLGLTGSTWVGKQKIIPINKTLAAGVTDQAELDNYFRRWMRLNDMRFVMMTASWIVLMWYFIARADKPGRKG